MIRIDLDGKIYRVNYVSASALKAIDSLLPVLKSGPERGTRRSFSQDLDKMVQWFCLLFNNQFSIEDVYASYPSDYLLRDIFLALMAVKSNNSLALVSFPTKPLDAIKNTLA